MNKTLNTQTLTLKRYITAIMLLLAAGIYTDACAQTKLGTGIRKLLGVEKKTALTDYSYPEFTPLSYQEYCGTSIEDIFFKLVCIGNTGSVFKECVVDDELILEVAENAVQLVVNVGDILAPDIV